MYRETIDVKIAECMKSGQKVELSVWRAIKNEFMAFKTGRDTAGKELTDEVEFKLIKKLADQRKDSADQFKAAGRIDLETNERNELAVLEQMLPKEPTRDDVARVITEVVSGMKSEGIVVGMKDMKTIQSAVRAKFPTVSGSVVAEVFKTLI